MMGIIATFAKNYRAKPGEELTVALSRHKIRIAAQRVILARSMSDRELENAIGMFYLLTKDALYELLFYFSDTYVGSIYPEESGFRMKTFNELRKDTSYPISARLENHSTHAILILSEGTSSDNDAHYWLPEPWWAMTRRWIREVL